MAASALRRDDTTLGVKRRTKKRLNAAKVHPRETDDETVNRALDALVGPSVGHARSRAAPTGAFA